MYVKDIPVRLDLESVYLGSQLRGFVCEHPENLVITLQFAQFQDLDNNKYKVIEIHKGFLHGGNKGAYCTPSKEQTIYILDGVR